MCPDPIADGLPGKVLRFRLSSQGTGQQRQKDCLEFRRRWAAQEDRMAYRWRSNLRLQKECDRRSLRMAGLATSSHQKVWRGRGALQSPRLEVNLAMGFSSAVRAGERLPP